MATNIHQNVLEIATTPTNGQPWNFNGILQSYLIPRVIASDSALPPGARLLWGIIRQHSFRDGRCFASDETLAAALAVSRSQFIRHARALEKAGLMKATPRDGKTVVRELLWDVRFDGKVRKGVSYVTRGGVINDRGGVSDMTPPYKEEGVLKGVLKGKDAAVKKAIARDAPSSPAQSTPPEWTEEEYIRRGRACGFPDHVIERDLERLRQRRANPKAERMIKASELAPLVQKSIPQ